MMTDPTRGLTPEEIADARGLAQQSFERWLQRKVERRNLALAEAATVEATVRHLETMVARLIESVDAICEQVRLEGDLILKLHDANNRLAAARREIDRLQDPKHQNKARKRRDQW
jgi:hypothetical protein